MATTQNRIVAAAVASLIVAPFYVMLLAGDRASGLPLYAARSGRACDNCHVDPNGWENPSLAKRKCSLSCQTCHVDPTGGGMRNAAGRYYGRATLPAIATSPRPTQDWDRELAPFLYRKDRATTYTEDLPRGPNTHAEVPPYEAKIRDTSGFGTRPGAPSAYDLFQGRYGQINADPLLQVGGDARLAMLWSGNALVFPMQLDLPVALRPLPHVTLLVNTGARGRTSGFGDTFDDEHAFYFREAFVLLHRLPYQAYVKYGRFTPSFGLRLDDHTASIRRQFELDGSLPETRVTGVEIGAAPNYPFVNLSWFQSTSRARVPADFDIFDTDEGTGAAVNAGYRNEGWAVGTSYLMRDRPLLEGGDAVTYGAYAAFNPWHYWRHVPLTIQGELDYGTRKRTSGTEADQAAAYAELGWRLANGVNLILTYDWVDPDRDVVDDESRRGTFGLQITPYPGLTLDARVRALAPTAGGSDADLFILLHLWN